MGMMSENSKEAYNTLKALTNMQQHKSAVIEDSSGNILTGSTAVLNQCAEHCSSLYKQVQHINFASKLKLYKSLVTSTLFYGCETWTLLADSEKRIQAFKTKCLRKLLRIFYLEHQTNDWVPSKVKFLVGPQEPLLATVKRWKFEWLRRVTRHNSLFKTILQGTLDGGQCHSWQRKWWMDNTKEWTSLPLPELVTVTSWRKG